MMNNPFGPQQDPGLYAYTNLQSRMLKHVKAARVTDQIFSVVQKAFEESLKMENIPLTSAEKQRMLAQIMKKVLSDMLSKLEENSKS